MLRDAPFIDGETYHVYNRGAHKQIIFKRNEDYQRFMLLLHVANTDEPVNLRNTLRLYKGQALARIYEEEKPTKSLVDLYAYSLMPNHFHLVLKQKSENGLTLFARKVLTAYSMYFNMVYKHSGILSQGAFKSHHINNESYFRYIFSYVHLNPLSLMFPKWEEKGIENLASAREFLPSSHSSFYDYSVGMRPERSIINYETAPDFLKTQNDLEELLKIYNTKV
jgi:putative transposase